MYVKQCLIIFIAIFEFISAQLLSCSLENEQPKVCFKGKESIANADPFPLALNTTLKLQNIVDIDENEKSISIQMSLISKWKTPGLDRSKGTNQ